VAKAAISITGSSLKLKDLAAIAAGTATLTLAAGARRRMVKAAKLIQKLVVSGKTVYGVTTGFGRLAQVRVSPEDGKKLQVNLLRSHACGVGDPLPPEEVRLVLALRANTLAAGHSGTRPEVVDALLALVNRDVLPVVPEQGSVGASGDLAPLSHVGLVLIGEGKATVKGKVVGGRAALKAARLEPLKLEVKEGLSLINGTQVSTAIAAHAAIRANTLLRTADVVAAMTLEAMKGSVHPFAKRVADLRKHPGHALVSANVRKLMKGSGILESHTDCDKVQDAYSLRCVPQVHGTARDALAYVSNVLAIELNAVTDNPLLYPDQGDVVSAGNFHAEPVAVAADHLSLAITILGTMSERRTEQMVNPDTSGHPAFLSPHSGLHSGFMMAQVTAAALASENKTLAHPASADTIPTGASREDHVSMGPHAARKARQALANTEHIVAIEALCAAQGLDLLKPLTPGKGVAAAYRALRRVVPMLDVDRELAPDLVAAAAALRAGKLLAAAEKACGPIR
jgi:histidine ammonia-lyase